MRARPRIDNNHREIVEALRAVGASVQSLASIGRGCPDLLVGYRMRWYVMEVKSRGGKLTGDEDLWIALARGKVDVVYGVEDALEAIGAVQLARETTR